VLIGTYLEGSHIYFDGRATGIAYMFGEYMDEGVMDMFRNSWNGGRMLFRDEKFGRRDVLGSKFSTTRGIKEGINKLGQCG